MQPTKPYGGPPQTTDVAALADTLDDLGRSSILEIEHDGIKVPVLITPKGREVHEVEGFIDEYRNAPRRKRGTAHVTTLDSFIDHVQRHKDEDSVIFADVSNAKAPALLAVYDYNRQGETGAPRFGHHRAKYAFPVSTEWAAWTAQSGRGFVGQRDFAEFLEERIADVAVDTNGNGAAWAASLGLSLATPQRLLDLSKGLTIHAEAKVATYMNLSSGESQVSFAEQHKDEHGGAVKVPGAFVIAIPVFRGGVAYKLPVRLRYRVKDGGVSWAVSIERADRAFDDAVGEAAGRAAEKTQLPLFFGTPEA